MWQTVKRSLGREFNWPGAIVGAVVALVLSIFLDHLFNVSDGGVGFILGVGSSLVFITLGRKLVKRRAKP